jgi:hypothetical protein
MPPLTQLRAYESRMHRLSLKDAAQLEKAYKVHAERTHRASVYLHAECDAWERSLPMKNIDCVIVYLKVDDKLVPEIFDDWDKAKDFFDAADDAVKIEQLKIEE